MNFWRGSLHQDGKEFMFSFHGSRYHAQVRRFQGTVFELDEKTNFFHMVITICVYMIDRRYAVFTACRSFESLPNEG
jgi:hypothetical protein